MNFKKVAIILMQAALIMIPLVFSKRLYCFFDLPKTLVLYILAVLLIACFWLVEDPAKNSGVLGKYMAIYLSWLLVRALLSPNGSLAFLGGYARYEGWFFFFASGIFFFIGNWLKDAQKKFIITLLLVSAGISLLAIREYWNGCPYYSQRVISTIGNPMMFATYLILIVPLALGWIMDAPNRNEQGIGAVCLYLLIIATVFTFSRGGWGGLLIVSLLFVTFSWHRLRCRPRMAFLLVAVFGLAIGSSLLMIRYQPGRGTLNHPERIQTIVKQPVADPSRLLLLKMGWKIFLEHPLSGAGLNTVATSITKYIPIDLARQIPLNLQFDMIHNDLVQTLATQGIIGFLITLGLMGVLFVKWLAWMKLREGTSSEAALWAAIFTHIILIQFSFPWVGYTFIFWFYLGLLNRITSAENRPLPERVFWCQICKWAGVSLLIMAALTYGICSYMADCQYCIGYLHRKSLFQYEHYLTKAIRWAPWENEYHFVRADNAVRIMGDPHTSKVDRVKMSHVMMDEIFPLLEAHPDNFKYFFFLGHVFDSFNKSDKAEEHYRQALKLYPNYYPAHLYLGSLLARTGRMKQAEDCFRRVLAINPGNTEAQQKLNILLTLKNQKMLKKGER